MKLLVSDYDGTLNPDHKKTKYVKENVEAIRQMKEKGHHFMISTGRSYLSIQEEIKKYNIPYDYLSCNDGAILFDGDDNILDATYFNQGHLDNVIKEVKNSNFNGTIRLFDTFGHNSDGDILTLGLFSSVFSVFKDKVIIDKAIKKYDEMDLIYAPGNYFVETKGGKSRTIKIVENDYEDILTVGDNVNDLGMLKDYDGYKVLISYPNIYFKGIKTTPSVKNLVKKIIK